MIWYRNLYISEDISHKKAKIKWKIKHNAGQINVYVITLSKNTHNLLEMIPSWELMQKYYPKKDMFVVGVAKGYDEGISMAASIVMEVYQETGKFNVRDYILDKHKKRFHRQEKI